MEQARTYILDLLVQAKGHLHDIDAAKYFRASKEANAKANAAKAALNVGLDSILLALQHYPALSLELFNVGYFHPGLWVEKDVPLTLLCYFLQADASLEKVQSLLNLCPDPIAIVRKYDAMSEMSIINLACYFCTPEVIDFLILRFPEMATAGNLDSLLLRFKLNSAFKMPLYAVKSIFNSRASRVDPNTNSAMILHGLKDDWPEDFLRALVESHSSETFYAFKFSRKADKKEHWAPEIRSVSSIEKYEILSNLILKPNLKLLFFPQGPQEEGIGCILEKLKDPSCNLLFLGLMLPNLSDEDVDADSLLADLKRSLKENNSLRRVDLFSDPDDSYDMAVRLTVVVLDVLCHSHECDWELEIRINKHKIRLPAQPVRMVNPWDLDFRDFFGLSRDLRSRPVEQSDTSSPVEKSETSPPEE